MLTRLKRKATALWNLTRLRFPAPSWSMLCTLYQHAQMIQVVRILRSRHGCPWDRKQTFDSFLPYLKEEAAEVYEAARHIEERGYDSFAHEMGDLLFVMTFLIEICEEAGAFVKSLPASSLVEKMVRRHPHVFSDAPNDTKSIKETWQVIKKQEREQSPRPLSIIEKVKPSLSALKEAQNIGKLVATVGFEWPSLKEVWDKVREEVDELGVELQQQMERKGKADPPLQKRQKEELGDLFFSLTNLARHLKIDSEQALRDASEKFRRRFRYIETSLQQEARSLEQASLEEMEELWQQAKKIPPQDNGSSPRQL